MGKHIFLLCLALTLFLTGCVDNPSDAEKQNVNISSGAAAEAIVELAPVTLKLAPEDRSQALSIQSFVETPEGCYYGMKKPVGSDIGAFIYFCPRGGNAFYPLCSKPNCKHQDKDCNAYYNGSCFGYFDGALYAVNDGMGKLDVIKMNLDGTDHQVVASLKLRQMGGYEYAFHHGRLYLRSNNTFLPGYKELPDYLIVIDLSDASQTEPLAEYLQTEKLPAYFDWYYKDKMFGCGGQNDPTLTEVDLSTGEVLKRELGNFIGFYATDSTLYYFLEEEDGSKGEKSKIEPGFWEYDLESGTATYRGLPLEGISFVAYDGDYIYAEAKQENSDAAPVLYILSREYELLDSVALEIDLSLAAAASDRLYFYDVGSMDLINFYLDKSQIGSGKLKLIPIESVG